MLLASRTGKIKHFIVSNYTANFMLYHWVELVPNYNNRAGSVTQLYCGHTFVKSALQDFAGICKQNKWGYMFILFFLCFAFTFRKRKQATATRYAYGDTL